ncbi:MAG: V-type ATP synthase subunit D [Spirochaetes bacterium]|jgi:V/A-type H+-transporting ATPase subunit D|nr:V-type ATP synthase subunit D [Spirochaetota bacterium]
MAKVKLTKNELRNQKDQLKRFQRYLPTLQLKKQQLQMVIRQIEAQEAKKREERDDLQKRINAWVDVFGEDLGLEELVTVSNVETSTGNIAGIDIPVFESMEYEDIDWDLFAMPVWVDAAVERVKELVSADAELEILQEQHRLISEELRVTTQRVNLFEKVKIPEAKENIRQIRIYLGDQQTAEVVRGKIAKKKIEAKGE